MNSYSFSCIFLLIFFCVPSIDAFKFDIRVLNIRPKKSGDIFSYSDISNNLGIENFYSTISRERRGYFLKKIITSNERHWRLASSSSSSTISSYTEATKFKSDKLMQRWATGLSLGAIGTLWICSGNGVFTLGFLLTSLIAQNEYYSMVRATGVEPAAKTGIVASLLCYISAAIFPNYHELVMPMSVVFLMIWLLIFNKKSASISEISTSLLGMYYIGYLPSFWVRLRSVGSVIPMRLPSALRLLHWANTDFLTLGAVVTWWTWTSIVVADVGAYFVGKRFGKTKLSRVSSAAGSASPNKTVEGAIGGFTGCILFNIIGAYIMSWPFWLITGSAYGLFISFIALVGDLTASMMKRDAGMKDSGNILPGHGGLLDRIDSYMLTAPAAFFFITNVLPFAKSIKTIKFGL